MNINTFVKEFNRAFRPEVTNELTKVTKRKGSLIVQIGKRDAQFDLKTGRCVGSGTLLV